MLLINTGNFRDSSSEGRHGMKLFPGIMVLLLAASAFAEPYMAVRTGFKCSQCHLNQSGGAGRTEYGNAYTQYKLVMEQTQAMVRGSRDAGITSFDPKLNDAITIGGNFRTEHFATQKNKDAAASNQLNISEANLYLNVELVKNFLSFYVDQTVAPGATSNREIWMMARNLPLNSYMKVGRTLLPYGLRLMDDQAFIRAQTGYTYGRTDLAGEIGLEPGPFSAIANLTNTHFSSVGSITFRNFRVGGSYGATTEGEQYTTYGPFVGANYGRFTVMAEVDFIEVESADSTIKQSAQFYEVNFLPTQGVNLKTTFEYFDRNWAVANRRDGQARWTFGAEAFPVQFLQLGLYYRLNQFIPKNEGANQDVIIGRAHVFF
jgi:hypothetical protein